MSAIDPELGQAMGVLAAPAMMAASAGMAGGMGAGAVPGVDAAAMPSVTPDIPGAVTPPMDMAMAPVPSVPSPTMPTPEPSVLDSLGQSAVQGMDQYSNLFSGDTGLPTAQASQVPPLTTDQPHTPAPTPGGINPVKGAPSFQGTPKPEQLGAGMQDTTSSANISAPPSPAKAADSDPVTKYMDQYGKHQMKLMKMQMGMKAGGAALKGLGALAGGDDKKGRQASFEGKRKRRNQASALQARGRRQLLRGTQSRTQSQVYEGGTTRQTGAGGQGPIVTGTGRRKV